MSEYNFKEIESKWQKKWAEEKYGQSADFDDKPKHYHLVEFPYPSGYGLHVGHVMSYGASDAYCRMKRLQGYNVMFPVGWDAFGLPTENYAIKNKVKPQKATADNISNIKNQIQSLGLSFDWSREINTTDPDYYHWTQWIFLQFYKHGIKDGKLIEITDDDRHTPRLAYQAEMPVNWCPSCKINLANEEVIDGKCERCGTTTEKRMQKQWMLRITAYADRLASDLDTVDYLEKIKTQQINWIGKSTGTNVRFKVEGYSGTVRDEEIEFYTTRIDTFFGTTFVVLSPEHPILEKLGYHIQNYHEIKEYVAAAAKKSDLERTELQKEKTGIKCYGVYAVNPLNNEKIEIWVADYVLGGYGTGSVIGVPAHDQRDFEFATKHQIPIKQVVTKNVAKSTGADKNLSGQYFVFLHAYGDTSKDAFWPWLKEKVEAAGGKVFCPDLPNTNHPNVEEQVRYVLDNYQFTENTTIVTHSLGGAVAMKLLPQLKNKIDRLIMIAPPLNTKLKGDKLRPDLENCCDWQFDFAAIKEKAGSVVVLADTNDHIVPAYHTDEIAKSLDAQYFEKTASKTHYNGQTELEVEKLVLLCHQTESTGQAFVEYGILTNSGEFDGLSSDEAKIKITEKLKSVGAGDFATNYKLRDWIFSRQHYWGEPIPIVHCEKCGTVPISEDQLPLILPEVENYEPSDTGESPLAKITEWVETTCPKCGGKATRETDTMPNWAGSSWYYLRYCDPRNNSEFAAAKNLKYWTPVDIYNGGMEHTTLHLLYSRFWHKFLFDLGVVPTAEPYAKRIAHGIILGPDGRKMSKSFGNVINPDEIVKEFGADTLRAYIMFIGPYDQESAWSTAGVQGVHRFLNRVWRNREKVSSGDDSKELLIKLNQTIAGVTADLENFRMNTVVSKLMEMNNLIEQTEKISNESWQKFLLLLTPVAPHIASELFDGNILDQIWPQADKKFLVAEKITIVVQVNGKVRDKIEVDAEISDDELKQIVLDSDKIKQLTVGKEIKKIIIVPNKLVSIVFG